MLFVTLTFNQQNCQHPELHTTAARRCFHPHHPLAATSCGDCSIRPQIEIGSKSCRRDLPSYSCRSLHMLSLQHDSGNWSRPWEQEGLSDQDRYTVIGRKPSSPIRSCWYLYQAGSADQLPSTMSSTGGALHMKKQVGAIRRKIAKHGPGLRLCVQVIPRIFHGCVWFLAEQCTKEGQSNLQKVPSHGVFLPGEVSSVKDTQGRYLAFIEWEGCSVATS